MATEDDWAWFRDLVTKERQTRKWSQNAAAKRAGVAAKTWSNLESGLMQVAPGVKRPHTPDEETVRLVALALDLDTATVSARLGTFIPDRPRAPVADQVREVRELAEQVIRRLDEIEGQLE